MKHFVALLLFGFLFKSSPTVIVLDKNCDVKYHLSAPVIRVIPTGLIELHYGPNSVEALVIDKDVQEVHVLDKGRYTFFSYSGQILHKVLEPNCKPL